VSALETRGDTRVKGQGFRGILSAIELMFGSAALADVRTHLDRETKLESIVASGWYPLAWYRDLHRAAALALPGETDLAYVLGREAMRQDLGGVYRFVLRLLGPDRTFRHAEKVLSTYWENARFTAIEEEPGRILAKFSEMRGLDDACWRDLVGGTTVIAETTMGREARLTVLAGGRRGHESMTAELAWKV
jgi:hypothetical protein